MFDGFDSVGNTYLKWTEIILSLVFMLGHAVA
jgi:hypothetical protein